MNDEPEEDEPRSFVCPICRGCGCLACDNTGLVDAEVHARLSFTERLADLADVYQQQMRREAERSD